MVNRVTIKDVAEEAGLSTASVSRVLNDSGYASEETRERVFAAVDKLDYQPNAVARSLKRKKTNTVGIVLPDITNPFFMQISRGVEDAIRRQGFNLIFCSTDGDLDKERELLEVLNEKRVEAVVLAPAGGNEERVARTARAGIPVILVDGYIETGEVQLDFVAEDNVKGAYELTKHLLNSGHTEIGVVNGSLDVSTGHDRYQGFKEAMEESGIEIREELVFGGDFTEASGHAAAEHFLGLSRLPSAILSFSNGMTFGLLLELTRRGIGLSEDFVIGSYGDVRAARLLNTQNFIYVKHRPYEMGLETGKILLQRLKERGGSPTENAVRRIFEPELSF